MRIEDTDQSRWVDGAEDYITTSLKWLGIKQDEGPKKKDVLAHTDKAKEKEIYTREIVKLIKAGKAYYAFDSDEKLAEPVEENTKKKGSHLSIVH